MPRSSQAVLKRLLLVASRHTIEGATYRHFKHPARRYKVLQLAIQEASEKVCVMYQDTSTPDSPPFVRDLDSWLEKVEWEGSIIPRFTRIDAP